MPEEGEEQEVENLFENIRRIKMKENFPNVAKEIDHSILNVCVFLN